MSDVDSQQEDELDTESPETSSDESSGNITKRDMMQKNPTQITKNDPDNPHECENMMKAKGAFWFWIPAIPGNLMKPGRHKSFDIPESTVYEDTPGSHSTIESSEESSSSDEKHSKKFISPKSKPPTLKLKPLPPELSDEEKETEEPVVEEEFFIEEDTTVDEEMKTESLPEKKKPQYQMITGSELAKFKGWLSDGTGFGSFQLDQFTHGFYELYTIDEVTEPSGSDSTPSKKASPEDTTNPSVLSLTPRSNKSDEAIALSTTHSIGSKPDIPFIIEPLSARSSSGDSVPEEPTSDELYLSGNYPLFSIPETAEPTISKSEFKEFPLKNELTKGQSSPLESDYEIETTPGAKVLSKMDDSEYETVDETCDEDSSKGKLKIFSEQEFSKLPRNKIGIRFKQIIKVNGKMIFDCQCNYDVLPLRYRKKYKNPVNLLLEFNYLLLPNENLIHFSTHCCTFTIQEVVRIMDITGGQPYLPTSFVKFILSQRRRCKTKKKKDESAKQAKAAETKDSPEKYVPARRPARLQRRRNACMDETTEEKPFVPRPSTSRVVPPELVASFIEDKQYDPVFLRPSDRLLKRRTMRPPTRRKDSSAKRDSSGSKE